MVPQHGTLSEIIRCIQIASVLPVGAAAGVVAGEGAWSAGATSGVSHSLEGALQAGEGAVEGGPELDEEVAPERKEAPGKERRCVPAGEEASGGSPLGRLYHRTAEQAAGLLEGRAQFLHGGGLLCYEPQRSLCSGCAGETKGARGSF